MSGEHLLEKGSCLLGVDAAEALPHLNEAVRRSGNNLEDVLQFLLVWGVHHGAQRRVILRTL